MNVVGNRVNVVASGVIPTASDRTHGERLHIIHETILHLERDYGPLNKTIVRERGFSQFHKATQALFKTHGVIEEALHRYDIAEYSPGTVKKTLTGNNKATKPQVAVAVSNWLTAPVTFATDDESDALAVAITHLLKTEELTDV